MGKIFHFRILMTENQLVDDENMIKKLILNEEQIDNAETKRYF